MKKLFAIVAVIGAFTFGSINLLRLKTLLQQNKLNNKLLLLLKLLQLLLLLQKKVVFTRKSKLNSSKVLHLS